jgi:acetyltransferase-like isoleucine patch superfamily enzyme
MTKFIPTKIHESVKFGKDVTIIEPCNLYGCNLNDGVFVGPFVEIQKNVSIGERTKIQSHSFICELVKIGADCFIGHGVMFVNDLFAEGRPANGKKHLWKETSIGKNVSIGSNATILPISVCENVVIGAGSVVTKNIKISGIYAGNPARLIREL